MTEDETVNGKFVTIEIPQMNLALLAKDTQRDNSSVNYCSSLRKKLLAIYYIKKKKTIYLNTI